MRARAASSAVTPDAQAASTDTASDGRLRSLGLVDAAAAPPGTGASDAQATPAAPEAVPCSNALAALSLCPTPAKGPE